METVEKYFLELGEFAQIGLPQGASQPDVQELGFSAHLDQSGRRQFFDMVRQGSRRDRKMAAKITAGHFVGTSNVSQNLVSARVGQGFGYPLKLF